MKNTQVLFLSHGTNGNLLNNEKDTFFDLMPQYISSNKNIKCAVLYKNQNLFSFRKNNKLLSNKDKELTHIMMPKFLTFPEHLKYVSSIGRFALQALIKSLRCYFEKPDISRILICSISWYFSRATYSNILLLNRLKEVQLRNNLASVFLTFEGHSFEQLLIDGLNVSGQKTKIYLYQHSPIVPLHYGVRSFLMQCKPGVTILTTGIFYKEYFQTFSSVPIYKVVGTNKSKFLSRNQNSRNLNKIIYAPEGTIFATKEFVKLIKNIIENSTENLHFLRLHPDLRLSSHLKIELRRLRKYENFFISSSDLDTDLMNTNYLLYRSSAVGIEALKYDPLPVFYADSKLVGLNVLFSNDSSYYKAENPSEVITILKSHRNKLSKTEREVLFSSYFSNINYKILDAAI